MFYFRLAVFVCLQLCLVPLAGWLCGGARSFGSCRQYGDLGKWSKFLTMAWMDWMR